MDSTSFRQIRRRLLDIAPVELMGMLAPCAAATLSNRTLAEMLRSFRFADPTAVGGLDNAFPRYNGAPQA